MKFGCCCKREHIPLLAAVGFDYAELSAYELANLSDREFAQVQEDLKRCKIPCVAVNDYADSVPAMVGEGFDPQSTREYARIVCRRAYEVGARCIGIGAPNARVLETRYSYFRAFEQAVQYVRIVCEEASAYEGLTIAMEALNLRSCNFCNTQHQALAIVQAAGKDNLKLETDFYHMFMMAEDFASVRELAPVIAHMHISEKDPGDTRCYPEESDHTIFRAAGEALRAAKIDGNISVEAPLSTLSEEKLALSLRLMRQYLLH